MRVEVVRWIAPEARVEIEDTVEPQLGEACERLWRERCAERPELHDGPVLAVRGVDAATGVIRCSRSTYKRFISGIAEGVGIETLGVSGVCVRGDAEERRILLAKRGAGVRIYGGMWETAPRGGVDAPSGSGMSHRQLVGMLEKEAGEELGAGISLKNMRVIAAVRDPGASSIDLVFAAEFVGEVGGDSWEYSEHRWVTMDELIGWARGEEWPNGATGKLSPPTAALALWPGFSGCVRR